MRFRTPLVVAVAFLAGIGTTTLAQSAASTVTLRPGESVLVVADDVVTTPLETTVPPTTVPPTTVPPTTVPPTTVPPTTVPPTTVPPTTVPPTTVPASGFVETFDGNAGLDRFRTGVFHRERDAFGQPNWVSQATWQGDHDLACGAATTKRTLSARTGSTFNDDSLLYACRDHLMTSMGDVSGYSVVWFSPDQTFDTISEVCFDVGEAADLYGPRQWWEVAILPASSPDVTANPGISGTANLTDFGTAKATVWGFAEWPHYYQIWTGNTKWLAGTDYNATDITARPEHCIKDNRNGTLTISAENGDGSPYVRTGAGSFPAGPLKVVFKDHNYNPTKGCGQTPTGRCESFTWHWDNIIVKE